MFEQTNCNLKRCKIGITKERDDNDSSESDCNLCTKCPNNLECPYYLEYRANEAQADNDLSKYNEDNLPYTSPTSICKDTKGIEVPDIKSKSVIQPDKPTVLIMDDFSGIISLLIDDLKYFGKNITEELNILYADGNMAAFSVKKFLDEYKQFHEERIEINPDENQDSEGHPHIISSIKALDVVLLDITIGGFNYVNDEMVEYDGIDIAKFIKELFPSCKIWFITGHRPNKKHPKIYKYMEKFKMLFGEEINPYIISKNGSRIPFIEKDINRILQREPNDGINSEFGVREERGDIEFYRTDPKSVGNQT